MNEEIKKRMLYRDNCLSKYACLNKNGIRFNPDKDDIRPNFFRDIDRIIYSLSYTRYIDKTQVFSFNNNDHISKRMTHVQMVSKIARTIGRALGLNEDLIEASGLGHDLGHVPFGHEGEYILNDISLAHGEGYFNHNVQSVRLLMDIENDGRGTNLCLQTLDAILCHNGELEAQKYAPINKTKEEFLEQYKSCYKDKNACKKLVPMTLEGCVVRISDIIAYIGRDVEDAVRIGLISYDDLPESIVSVLGGHNREIINTIITDIINNSIDKPYISMSDDVFKAMCELKKFNYSHIYTKCKTQDDLVNYRKMFETLFDTYLNHLKSKFKESDIYTNFLDSCVDRYLNNTSNERKVIDYIAGMTDDYFIFHYKKWINYNK